MILILVLLKWKLLIFILDLRKLKDIYILTRVFLRSIVYHGFPDNEVVFDLLVFSSGAWSSRTNADQGLHIV